ncbi:arabinogalactan oligomer / maltooligosaccharide transport system permease protein [Candidatus Hakubella thermalkaliphila]|uniref:Maltose/maltodextrin transport system permease protein n=1 Tax=Candidatus Hakubella thermalkaliphila TaxID=2754717 RepID=A0A6V8PLX0_9ACTN|nr:arabinogalactan oligomer / maltooligosaccharide transport system permease protein [Candidatus Hakubella thermalkaliphila]
MKCYSEKASILSILFMGLGQLYNRQFGKGILFAAVEILFIVYMLPFVSRGLWGLVTLGEIPQRMEAGKILPGDHSIFLMIYGIMSVLLLLVFAAIYVMNYFDARRVGEQRDKGKPVKNIINSIATLYEKGFPYLVLTPAGIFLLFLTVLPLIFGILSLLKECGSNRISSYSRVIYQIKSGRQLPRIRKSFCKQFFRCYKLGKQF